MGSETTAYAHVTKATSPFAWVVLSGIFANVVLSALFNATNIGIFSTMQNASAGALVVFSFFALLLYHRTNLYGALYVILWVIALTIHTLINVEVLDSADWLKVVSIFLLFVMGRNLCFQYEKRERFILFSLAAIPIFIEISGGSRVYHAADSFGIFQNKNTAILYYMSIFFALSPVMGKFAIISHVLIVLLFQKIGILIATVVGLGAPSVARLQTRSVVVLIVMGAALAVGYWLGLLERPLSVVTMLVADLSTIGLQGITQLSFAGLYERTQSTDLSGYFRLIHWSNILNIMSNGDLAHILFGFGGGLSEKVTTMQLVPHNDYLKILFEYGVVFFALFSCLLIYIYRNLKRKEQKALFLILCIYFFSENVVNNYSSMALFFFFAGLALGRRDLGSVRSPVPKGDVGSVPIAVR